MFSREEYVGLILLLPSKILLPHEEKALEKQGESLPFLSILVLSLEVTLLSRKIPVTSLLFSSRPDPLSFFLYWKRGS